MKGNWNLREDVLNAEVTVNEMVDAIRVFEILKSKYPNDDTITGSILYQNPRSFASIKLPP